MSATDAMLEAERLMTVCNACRYCEGLCAVFPAMEMRRTFAAGDLTYLANLCHQCGACYADCQYSPPHEFSVNVPASLARLRNESYKTYAWPKSLSSAFECNGLVVTVVAALSIAAFVIGFVAIQNPAVLWDRHAGNFYALMPHNVMAALFSLVTLYVILALTMSLRAFWHDINGRTSVGLTAVGRATADAAHLTYLHGGGGGCTSEDEKPSSARRVFHHLTFYGFLLCFAATCVATLYHYALGWSAPYPPYSTPVVLGLLGGVGLLVGPAGLFALARHRDPVLTDRARRGMDTAFILMLFLTGLTGLLLLVLRDTGAMAMLLALHLGVVLGLFLSLPYGKFVHGLYRYLALVKYAREKKSGVMRS